MITAWPALPADAWADTLETLHRYTQIVGKIRMGYGPWLNHSWGVTLYVTPRGLSTGIVPHGEAAFEARLDLLDSALVVEANSGRRETVGLQTTVAEVYAGVLAAFERLGLPVSIDPLPSEIADAIPFDEDTEHGPYDPAHAQLMLRAWIDSERVMSAFRAQFVGKSSPVHLYWGGMDLAVYRFSGRAAPEHPGGGAPNLPLDVERDSYSHEVTAVGLWLGSRQLPYPGFFAYTYPAPDRLGQAEIAPEAASWNEDGGLFNLPYEAVRTADDPDAALLAFCESTHAAGAALGGWDRAAVELDPPQGAGWWRHRSRRVSRGG